MKTYNRNKNKRYIKTKRYRKTNNYNKTKKYKKNKLYRKTKCLNKRNKLKMTRGGNGPLYPDIPITSKKSGDMNKQIIIDAKKAVLSILKERQDAEMSESMWQNDEQINTDNNYLQLNSPLPDKQDEYNPSPFWDKLFTLDELEKIVGMLNTDVCSEIKALVPAFENKPLVEFPEPIEETSSGVKVYNIDNIIHYTRNQEDVDKLKTNYDIDFPEKSKIMCATLMILGIITSKMIATKQKYTIVGKGGVAVSFALSNLIGGMTQVPVNDLDFKLIPTYGLQSDIQSTQSYVLAKEICWLITWLLKSVVGSGYSISLLEPSAKSPNQQVGYKDIIKVSIKRSDGKYIPILDLDFGSNVQKENYFEHNFRIEGKIPADIGLPVSYIYQSDRQMLAEKMYYYTKYFLLRKQLLDNDSIIRLRLNPDSLIRTPYGVLTYDPPNDKVVIEYNGEKLDVATCDRFLEKFKRSILLLIDGIKQTNPTTKQFETVYGGSELTKRVFTNTLDRLLIIQYMIDLVEPKITPKLEPNMRTEIINSIYARELETIV